MLSLRKGSKVLYRNEEYEIINPIDLQHVLGINLKTSDIIKLPVNELSNPISAEAPVVNAPIEGIRQKDWDVAKQRFEIIKPLLKADKTKKEVEERGKETGISTATIYLWIERYLKTGTLVSLVPNYTDKGGKGKSRLNPQVESVIDDFIKNEYLTKQKKSIIKVAEDIKMHVKLAGLPMPSVNTIRNRIKILSPTLVYKSRRGRSEFLNNFSPVKDSFDAKFPLEIIEIDHTPLDIIIVDEIMRKPIGRPYITLAVDIYSRMVFGFYISLQTPSFFSVGQALYMGIMPKNNYLESLGINGDWNTYGLPKNTTIHLDNAAEFRGAALKRFGEEFNIEINFRPKGAPYYGGHIERIIKTINMRIHNLHGSTFSNPKERGQYDSEGKAAFTIKELEKWIAEFIVNYYHKTVHSEINMTPEKKYEIGILGDDNNPGTGLPDIIDKEESERIRITLLPFVERTVQKNGISFEDIKYYSDVLRKYIRIEDVNKKRKSFTIRFDPRDISKVYFYEPDLKTYFQIPYRNMGYPSISIWEIRESKKYIRKEGLKSYDEDKIFQAFKKLRQIETESFEKTKSVRRKLSSNGHHKEKMKLEVENRLKLTPSFNNGNSDSGGGGEEVVSDNAENMKYKKADETGTHAGKNSKDEVNNEIEAFEIDTYDED